MKLPENVSDFNSLVPILYLLESKDAVPLTTQLLDSIIATLALGKIECENREEGIKCLEVLDKMGVIVLLKKQESTGTSFLIGNLYNGK